MSGLDRLKKLARANAVKARRARLTGVHSITILQAVKLCGPLAEVMATEDLIWTGRKRTGPGLVYGCFTREELGKALESHSRIELDLDDRIWPLRAYEGKIVTLKARVRT